jgi:hypothetical protein
MTTQSVVNVPCREARKAQRQLYERAHHFFMDRLEVFIDTAEFPLSYDLCEQIKAIHWYTPIMGLSIGNDLCEAINQLHSWYQSLVDLSLWIEVLKEFDDEDQWSIRSRYVEPLAFYCMLQPSATRDRFGTIATSALHQANLHVQAGYKDSLDQDRQGFLSRNKREAQLKRLGSQWSAFQSFLQTLAALDAKEFSQASLNFRNLASHGIAPRFEQGESSFVTRAFVPRSELLEQLDGSYRLVDHPIEKAVSYGFGGTPPLSFQTVHDVCSQQYLKALGAFHAYRSLLREVINVLTSQPETTPQTRD